MLIDVVIIGIMIHLLVLLVEHILLLEGTTLMLIDIGVVGIMIHLLALLVDDILLPCTMRWGICNRSSTARFSRPNQT